MGPVKSVTGILKFLVELLVRKNFAYGGENISMTGVMGIVVRLTDKVFRFRNLIKNPDAKAYESIEDTLNDIIGYVTIGIMLIEGTWGLRGENLAKEAERIHKYFILTPEDYMENLGRVADVMHGIMLHALSGTSKESTLTGDLTALAVAALVGHLLLPAQQDIQPFADGGKSSEVPYTNHAAENGHLDMRTGLWSGNNFDDPPRKADPVNATE